VVGWLRVVGCSGRSYCFWIRPVGAKLFRGRRLCLRREVSGDAVALAAAFFRPRMVGRNVGAFHCLSSGLWLRFLSSLDGKLWAVNPTGYHLTNLLLHLACLGFGHADHARRTHRWMVTRGGSRTDFCAASCARGAGHLDYGTSGYNFHLRIPAEYLCAPQISIEFQKVLAGPLMAWVWYRPLCEGSCVKPFH
jgi:hypothetical protein